MTKKRWKQKLKKRSVQSFKEDSWSKVSTSFCTTPKFLYIYEHNMRPNFTEKNNIRTMYLQIPCQTLSVICLEIEGKVKLSENVHNIWMSARKPVVCPQTRYRTRRNIIPKFLKNAMKTLFAFCVFNNGGIYLSIPRKAKTCMLFRSNAHKNSRNFSCVHHYFFCSHHG